MKVEILSMSTQKSVSPLKAIKISGGQLVFDNLHNGGETRVSTSIDNQDSEVDFGSPYGGTNSLLIPLKAKAQSEHERLPGRGLADMSLTLTEDFHLDESNLTAAVDAVLRGCFGGKPPDKSSLLESDRLSQLLLRLLALLRRYLSYSGETEASSRLLTAVREIAADCGGDAWEELQRAQSEGLHLRAMLEDSTRECSRARADCRILTVALEARSPQSLALADAHAALTEELRRALREQSDAGLRGLLQRLGEGASLHGELLSARARVLELEAVVHTQAQALLGAQQTAAEVAAAHSRRTSEDRLRLEGAMERSRALLAASRSMHAESEAVAELAGRLKRRLRRAMREGNEREARVERAAADKVAASLLEAEGRVEEARRAQAAAAEDSERVCAELRESEAECVRLERERSDARARLHAALEEKQALAVALDRSQTALRGAHSQRYRIFKNNLLSHRNLLVSGVLQRLPRSLGAGELCRVVDNSLVVGDERLVFDGVFEASEEGGGAVECGMDMLVELAFEGRPVAVVGYGHRSSLKGELLLRRRDSVLYQALERVFALLADSARAGSACDVRLSSVEVTAADTLVDALHRQRLSMGAGGEQAVSGRTGAWCHVDSLPEADDLCGALHDCRARCPQSHIVTFIAVTYTPAALREDVGEEEQGVREVALCVADLAWADRVELPRHASAAELKAGQRIARSFSALKETLLELDASARPAPAYSAALLTSVMQDFLTADAVIFLLVALSAQAVHAADNIKAADFAAACKPQLRRRSAAVNPKDRARSGTSSGLPAVATSPSATSSAVYRY